MTLRYQTLCYSLGREYIIIADFCASIKMILGNCKFIFNEVRYSICLYIHFLVVMACNKHSLEFMVLVVCIFDVLRLTALCAVWIFNILLSL